MIVEARRRALPAVVAGVAAGLGLLGTLVAAGIAGALLWRAVDIVGMSV